MDSHYGQSLRSHSFHFSVVVLYTFLFVFLHHLCEHFNAKTRGIISNYDRRFEVCIKFL